jgi:hypothetical protein
MSDALGSLQHHRAGQYKSLQEVDLRMAEMIHLSHKFGIQLQQQDPQQGCEFALCLVTSHYA